MSKMLKALLPFAQRNAGSRRPRRQLGQKIEVCALLTSREQAVTIASIRNGVLSISFFRRTEMKPSILWACAFTVLLWTGAEALGQGKGQGKGQDKNNAARVKENAPAANQAPQTVEPSAGKTEQEKEARRVGKNAMDAGKSDVAKGKKAMESAGEAMKGKGKEHQQHLQALDKQLRHEQAKQMQRQARLNRIRELAVQKGDTETVARVDKLIAKLNEVYGRTVAPV